jgi:phospholipid/cholesterol/gamma-HCH transport system permease protein
MSMTIGSFIAGLQNFYGLAVASVAGVFRREFSLRDLVDQMDYVGAGSFLIVLLVSLFIGMALSLQISAELAPLGLRMYTAKVVGISIIREIGPVAVSLAFAGRVGSGMASELGSMVLGHQVDMLRVFGMNPIVKLVTPRVISATLMLPLLTVAGDAVALIGGWYIAVAFGLQSGSFYWSQIIEELNFTNILSGTLKPLIFGYLIACISCAVGLTTSGGARGLRRATTTAVVISTVMIIIVDFLITQVLFFLLGMQA